MPARLTPRRPAVAVNAALAVALVAGGFGAYEILRGPQTSTPAGASARSVPVRRGTVTKTVTADGTIQSASIASADFVTAGTVTEIDVKVGQVVKKGQVLAKVDPAAALRGLHAARAGLDAANDALDRAESAGSDTSSAENEVDQAKLAVDEAEAAVAGTTLKAPMAGTVTAVNGTLGSTSSGSGAPSGRGGDDTATAGSGFVAIADLHHLQVSAAFAEAGATRLKEKQAATVTWNALSGATAPATVTAIDPSATTSNNVVTYGVTLTLGKVPAGAKVGQTVSVAVTTGSVRDAVFVDSAAVTTIGNQHTVSVLVDGVPERRAVRIGLEGDEATQITSGVQVGEMVVLKTATTGTGTGNPFTGGGFGGFAGGGRPGGGFRGAGGGGR